MKILVYHMVKGKSDALREKAYIQSLHPKWKLVMRSKIVNMEDYSKFFDRLTKFKERHWYIYRIR